MAVARLPLDVFERGTGPEICAHLGIPTTDRLNVDTETPVGIAGYVLLVLGIVPYLIYRAISSRPASGSIGLSAEAWQFVCSRRRARVRTKALAAGVVVAVLVIAVVAGSDVLRLVGVLGTLVAAGFAVVVPGSRWLPFHVEVERSGRWIDVVGCHEAYAQAVDRQVRGA